jgi:SulP family sulfate permease
VGLALTPRRALIGRDVLAGVTVALVLIPQSLAYAGVAGMPPAAGLYAAALPPIAAAVFASSPYLQTGPVAMTSLLTFGALAGRAPVGSEAYLELGVLLALVVGAVRLLVGLLRAGVVAHLLSEPMLMGFIPAAAMLIVASQVPAVVGGTSGGGVLDAAASALTEPRSWDPAALAFAACALAVILLARRVHRLLPGALIALAVGLAAGVALGDPAATVGAIPAGLPAPQPDLPYGELPSLLLPGAVIALVGFAEVASIARTYATRERHLWDADREFVSQGIANLTAGLSGSYPVGGSLTRTSLNHSAGAASRLSGAITGVVVLAFLPIASVLERLPEPVLAGIVISTVLGLVRVRRIVALWRVSKPQFLVAGSTFALTLALAPHVELAILAGLALSIAVHLVRELTLALRVTVTGGTLEVRPAGVLWFATTHDLQQRLIELLGRYPEATRLRLALDGLGRIDLTGAIALAHTLDDVARAGLEVEVTGVPPQAIGLLERYARQRPTLD